MWPGGRPRSEGLPLFCFGFHTAFVDPEAGFMDVKPYQLDRGDGALPVDFWLHVTLEPVVGQGTPARVVATSGSTCVDTWCGEKGTWLAFRAHPPAWWLRAGAHVWTRGAGRRAHGWRLGFTN